ncbi:Ribosomal-protein-alanine acetyltransferase [Minicystis rosea]|nr:Ribosomal-protein-alanine acetyltransferase [Minicystis rosea]
MEQETAAPLPIRRIRVSGGDADAYARHIVAHMAESGRAGMPHFALSRTWVQDEIRASLIMRISKALDEPLWGRAWGLFAEDGTMVGHVELRGGRVPAEMHRATLGMGIMRAHTAQGHGRRLIETTVKWAREEAELEWIDLGVFADNAPARKLYQRMGFVEIGTRRDAFHLDSGVKVDDVLMVLRL